MISLEIPTMVIVSWLAWRVQIIEKWIKQHETI